MVINYDKCPHGYVLGHICPSGVCGSDGSDGQLRGTVKEEDLAKPRRTQASAPFRVRMLEDLTLQALRAESIRLHVQGYNASPFNFDMPDHTRVMEISEGLGRIRAALSAGMDRSQIVAKIMELSTLLAIWGEVLEKTPEGETPELCADCGTEISPSPNEQGYYHLSRLESKGCFFPHPRR